MRSHIILPRAALAFLLAATFAAGRDETLESTAQSLGVTAADLDNLEVVIVHGPVPERRRDPEAYDPSKDILSVEFGHVAEDRFLWRVNLAAPPNMDDTTLHIYVDADDDPDTGRKGPANALWLGTDNMLSVSRGNASPTRFTPDGTQERGPWLRWAVDGSSVLYSTDIPLNRDEEGFRFSMYVLCHTASGADVPKPMRDRTPRVRVEGIPAHPGEKIILPTDATETTGASGTCRLADIRALLAHPGTIEVAHDRLELDGYEIDQLTSRRWPHLRRTAREARAWTAAPRAGRYHVGFLIYDDNNDQRFSIRVGGRNTAIVFTRAGTYREWLYWTDKAFDFEGGETVEVEAFGPGGRHGIINIVFMPEPPEAWSPPFEIQGTAAFAPAAFEGRVNVSWTTTWPGESRFEYGDAPDALRSVEESPGPMIHRAVIEGLDPAKRLYGRAIAEWPDGRRAEGPVISFSAAPPTPPPTLPGRHTVHLAVRNPHPFEVRQWPIATGVPFPQGALASAGQVRLTRDGAEVPAQVSVSGYWPDGSVKWILVRFSADAPAKGEATYGLEFGGEVRPSPWQGASALRTDEGVEIDTGAIQVLVDERGGISGPFGPEAGATDTFIRDAAGAEFRTSLGTAELTIEEEGPARVVVKTSGHAVSADGERSFLIEQRVMAYHGAAFVRVHHTFLHDLPETWADIGEIALETPLAAEGWTVLLEDGTASVGSGAPPVWQRTADEYLDAAGAVREGRLTGTLLPEGTAAGAVAVREAWQQYPKGFQAAPGKVAVHLAPPFDEGFYDQFPFEKEGNQLYYYLLNGRYRFRQGMAKTHEVLLSFGPPDRRGEVCALFQRPLLATAPPAWYCNSKAFYAVAPRDMGRFRAYEEAMDRNMRLYLQTRERQRDYGLMNYGDWFGERGANWGNMEYDTPHVFLLEYIRSGNPDAFFLAEAAEIHNRDIDTVNWAPDPRDIGLVYLHQMSHVGGYWDESVPGTLGIPRAGGNIGHAWVEGRFGYYFLTGDRRSLEVAMAVSDYWIRRQLSRPFDFTTARVPGWHLIMLSAAYAATCDPYYLNAARVIVERVLETQDREPRPLPPHQAEPGRTHQHGTWSRMMRPGHCHCEPRHRGNAGFMVAVLLSGLKYYHDVVPDPRVKEAIILGAHGLLDECYSDEAKGFRYTSCPATRYRSGATPLMAEGIARAYLWTGDDRLKGVLTAALPIRIRGSRYGKGFSQCYRSGPRLLADLAKAGLELNEAASAPRRSFKRPEWLDKTPADRLVVVQAEDFTAQGGGEVLVAKDRASWGDMITYWHHHRGHWLEWRADIPREGTYRVVFRYATSSRNTVRDFMVDGEHPAPEARSIAFPPTGGFGHDPDEWADLELKRADGTDLLLHLKEGPHTLRMSNLRDGLGLDFIALIRVDP